ncbi:MAG: hypothetical protein PHW96_02310 [Candidatus Nanoarchaeia archaeon]|nr:hypothetical protein [Candidatus Nanoarchaeia archaeon]
MAVSITIPQIGEKSNAKDYIISILSHEWPLNPKQIHNRIKSKYGYDITYQATYKTIKELFCQEVISKKGALYELNLKWIKEVHRYTEMVESNYYTKNRLNLIDGIKDAKSNGDLTVLTFENYFDVEKYLYYMQKHYILSSGKKEIVVSHHKNEWRPVFYLRAEYNWVKKLREMENEIYVLCSGSTAIDKWCSGFYNKIGCNVKTGVNVAETNELMVFGDYIVQIYVPEEIHKKINETYSNAQKIEDVQIDKTFEEIFGKITEIKVIINKDAKMAEELKNKTMNYFK